MYKVRVQDFIDGLSTDIYTVQILDVIKEGLYLFIFANKSQQLIVLLAVN